MNKLLLIILLALISTSAMAEWTQVAGGDNGNLYVDRSTVRKNGNKAKIWGLIDYSSERHYGDKSYLSSKSLVEYDCTEETGRVLYSTYHSEAQGFGNLIFTIDIPTQWRPVPPDSGIQIEFAIACGKK